MDDNAWDLVNENKPRLKEHQKSSVVSVRSRRTPSQSFGEMDNGWRDSNVLGGELDVIAGRKNFVRSRSPALESLRKVSRMVLQRFGTASKTALGTGTLESNEIKPNQNELPTVALEDYCTQRPLQYFYSGKVEQKNDAENFGTSKIVSAQTLKKTVHPVERKCAHLYSDSSQTAAANAAEDARRAGALALGRVYAYDEYCPMHGSRRRRRQFIDMHEFVASVETHGDGGDAEAEFSPFLDSQAYLAKMLRKRRRAFLSGEKRVHTDKKKRKILSNLWIISAAFLFLFTGFNGLQNLQTTVNGHMGADALSVFYISLAISSLFVPSFALNRLGTKMTLITAILIHIFYMFANFIPRYYSLIPASVLAGVAASCLWAAKCVYITESGIRYARLNVEAQNVVIIRFFGFFFMILHLSQVFGNILSSMILSGAVAPFELEDRVDETCGHNFFAASTTVNDNASTLSARALRNLARPAQAVYLLVVGVDLCCAVVALLIVALFLNALRADRAALLMSPGFSTRVLRATLQNLRRPKLLLLIPLTIFNGIEQAFIVGLYTKAYVACGLGVAQIGYVMTSFGVADAICSLVFGPLIKLFGRMPLFVFGCVINMLMIMTLMIWPLNPGDRALFSAIAGVWGMADGVWNTQLNGFWVGLLSGESLELAFANYRLWMSSGMAVGFLLMRFTNVNEYLLTSFCCLLVGILGYFVLELYDMFIDFLFAFAVDENQKTSSGK